LAYSAKKKKEKIIDPYSKLNPATNSPSASGKSKGARFVSATIAIKNITAIGVSKKKNQPLVCARTISIKFKELLKKKTGIIKSDIIIS